MGDPPLFTRLRTGGTQVDICDMGVPTQFAFRNEGTANSFPGEGSAHWGGAERERGYSTRPFSSLSLLDTFSVATLQTSRHPHAAAGARVQPHTQSVLTRDQHPPGTRSLSPPPPRRPCGHPSVTCCMRTPHYLLYDFQTYFFVFALCRPTA